MAVAGEGMEIRDTLKMLRLQNRPCGGGDGNIPLPCRSRLTEDVFPCEPSTNPRRRWEQPFMGA